jgi:hypothetical protein
LTPVNSRVETKKTSVMNRRPPERVEQVGQEGDVRAVERVPARAERADDLAVAEENRLLVAVDGQLRELGDRRILVLPHDERLRLVGTRDDEFARVALEPISDAHCVLSPWLRGSPGLWCGVRTAKNTDSFTEGARNPRRAVKNDEEGM